MATETQLLPVRKTLNERFGIGNERIGYDANTGYVTVDNKNVFKPPTNEDGTTYADESVFNSAAGQLNTLNNAYNIQQKVVNPQQQVNPMDDKFNQLLQTITGKMNNPAQMDPRNTDQYRAFQAQTANRTQNAIRSGQEAMGTSGMARSSDLAMFAQNAQNEANEYLETQVLPAIAQQEAAKQQQELGNLMSLIGVIGQQQGLYDTRAGREFDQAAKVLDFITGRDDRAEDVTFRNDRAAVADKQFDDKFAFEKDQAALQQQNLEEEKQWRRERASEEDKRWWSDYERRGQEFAQQMGYNWAQLSLREKEMVADQAYRNESLKLQKDRLDAESDPNSLDNRYKEAQIQKLLEASNSPDEKFTANRDAMLQQIRSGSLKPKDAIKTIQEDAQIGYYTQQQAKQLMDMVYILDPKSKGSSGSNAILQPQVPQAVEELGKSIESGAKNAIGNFGQWWSENWLDNILPGG